MPATQPDRSADGRGGPGPPVGDLADGLARAVRARLDEVDRATVLFSGGLDSSLVAWIARPYTRLELLTVGFPASGDVRSARIAAPLLGIVHLERLLRDEDLRVGWERWSPSISHLPPTDQAVALSLALALEAVPSRTVLCGQGADELFLGYAHFQGLDATAAERAAASDLGRLRDRAWPVAQSIAHDLGKVLSSPFLDEELVRAVVALPISERARGPVPKQLLRDVALRLGLPKDLVDRPKRAFQYGSGVARRLGRFRRDVDATAT